MSNAIIEIELTTTPDGQRLAALQTELEGAEGVTQVNYSRPKDPTQLIVFAITIIGTGFFVSGKVIELAKILRQQAKDLHELRQGEEKTEHHPIMNIVRPDGTRIEVFADTPDEKIAGLLQEAAQPDASDKMSS